MPSVPESGNSPLRLAEAVGMLALATDLGTGLPLEHSLRTCLLSVELGERVGLDEEDLSDLYYLTLLRMLGCTADSAEAAEYFSDEIQFGRDARHLDYGDPEEFGRWVMASFATDHPADERQRMLSKMFTYTPEQRRAVLAGHCEVAQMLARRLEFPSTVIEGLGYVFERWDGAGAPGQAPGEQSPLIVRVMTLCNEVEVHHTLGGPEAAVAVARRRAGGAFDPGLVEAFCRDSDRILGALDVPSAWDALMTAEPGRARTLRAGQAEAVGLVIADFADLKSVHTVRYSAAVAELATAAAARAGLSSAEVADLRLAALGHDLGRVAVTNAIWDKPGPLSEAEWEKVRLHPYYSERVLGRPRQLAAVARWAGAHHERLDGSGYHRGSRGQALPAAVRLLSAADAYRAMTQRRAHRVALGASEAAEQLATEASAGRLDADAVNAVLAVAGHRRKPVRRPWPAGLSQREVDVIRLAAQGLSIAETARELGVAAKTVDFHLQNVYSKAGVSTRAALTLFAIEHDLLATSATGG